MLEACFTKKLYHFTLDVNLKVDDQILVLWGPSGAGKTTILQCLAGLFKPTSGFIRLNNQALYSTQEKIDVPTRLRKVGYLFQDYALFPHMTVKQNVLYGLKSKNNRREYSPINPIELLNSFGVEHLVDRHPLQLSGGEKQRVALARALAVQPELLLLDEPFSALDRSNKMNLMTELKELHRRWKIPFILVSHSEEEAGFLGDVIFTMEQGRPEFQLVI